MKNYKEKMKKDQKIKIKLKSKEETSIEKKNTKVLMRIKSTQSSKN